MHSPRLPKRLVSNRNTQTQPEGNRLRASFGYGLRNGLGSRGKRPIPALKEAPLPHFFNSLFAHAGDGTPLHVDIQFPLEDAAC